MRAWIAAAFTLAAAGCSQGDGVVVLSVTASPALAGVATLHTSATVGATTRDFDVAAGTGGAAVTLPPAITFGIVVPAGLGSMLSVHVEARDSGGHPLASADGTAPVTAGQRTDATITFGSVALDGGADLTPPADLSHVDLAGVDFSGDDFSQPQDMTQLDFSQPQDLTPPRDLTVIHDLTVPRDLTMNPDGGVVFACGATGQTCCPYDSCTAGCCVSNTCIAFGQQCFSGGPTCQQVGANSQCGGGGANTCGAPGLQCCQASFCTEGFVMCSPASGQCTPCGHSGQACCPSSICVAGSACTVGANTCN
jgi:hypothetical protein